MIADSIKDKVRNIAKIESKTFNEVWKTLVLERFLARLALSDCRNNLIFKGGMLLAKYLPIGRETTDLDFLAKGIQSKDDAINSTINRIINTKINDGFSFGDLKVEETRHIQTPNPGYLISMLAILGETKTKIFLDIGIGDVVNEVEKILNLTKTEKGSLFEESISLQVYPIESIFAEKLESACFRSIDNSRMKDFHDLWMIIKKPNLVNIEILKTTLKATFEHRNTKLEKMSFGQVERLSEHWKRHLKSLSDSETVKILPTNFETIVNEINNWLYINLGVE